MLYIWAIERALIAQEVHLSSRIAWAMRRMPIGNSVNSAIRPMPITKMATSTSTSVIPARRVMLQTPAACGLALGMSRAPSRKRRLLHENVRVQRILRGRKGADEAGAHED